MSDGGGDCGGGGGGGDCCGGDDCCGDYTSDAVADCGPSGESEAISSHEAGDASRWIDMDDAELSDGRRRKRKINSSTIIGIFAFFFIFIPIVIIITQNK
jgi:hypothetical protein